MLVLGNVKFAVKSDFAARAGISVCSLCEAGPRACAQDAAPCMRSSGPRRALLPSRHPPAARYGRRVLWQGVHPLCTGGFVILEV